METMPIEAKIANVKGDIKKFIEVTARDFGLPPFLMVGVIADILQDWKSKELVQVNDAYNEIIKIVNEQIAKGGVKDVEGNL
nr:MAG TPA: hypothetical protein [Caudoviricetes sp.]